MTRSPMTVGILGTVIRVSAAIIYLLWALFGYKMIEGKQLTPDRLQYVARSDLPTGHRLRLADLKADPCIPAQERIRLPEKTELEGKYLRIAVCKEKPIRPQDLSVTPIIHVGAGKLAHFFSLQNQPYLVDILDVGSVVDVWATSRDLEKVKVVSIVSIGPPSLASFAVMELSKKQLARISGGNRDQYRLVLNNQP